MTLVVEVCHGMGQVVLGLQQPQEMMRHVELV